MGRCVRCFTLNVAGVRFREFHVGASSDLMFRPGCARTVQPRAGWESQNDDAGSQIFTSGMEHSALDSRRGVPRPAFLRTRPRVDQALAGSARAGELRRRSARNACRLRIGHTVKFHTIEVASESPEADHVPNCTAARCRPLNGRRRSDRCESTRNVVSSSRVERRRAGRDKAGRCYEKNETIRD